MPPSSPLSGRRTSATRPASISARMSLSESSMAPRLERAGPHWVKVMSTGSVGTWSMTTAVTGEPAPPDRSKVMPSMG